MMEAEEAICRIIIRPYQAKRPKMGYITVNRMVRMETCANMQLNKALQSLLKWEEEAKLLQINQKTII